MGWCNQTHCQEKCKHMSNKVSACSFGITGLITCSISSCESRDNQEKQVSIAEHTAESIDEF